MTGVGRFVLLAALGFLFTAAGAALILGRRGPDRTDARAGARFLGLGVLLLLASATVLP